MEPRIQYAKTEDGVSIAFTAFGEGPAFVLPPSLIASHLQMEWEMPGRRAVYERLAERATVIRYDPRGIGMSQVGAIDFTLESAIQDLEAVLNALDLPGFALYSRPANGDLPCAYAIQHPDRVSHLVLAGRLIAAADTERQRMFTSIQPLIDAEWELFVNVYSRLITGWDSADAAPLATQIRASHSPRTFRPAYDLMASRDPMALAPHVRVPTLILHALGDHLAASGARRLAAAIAGARIAGFPGESHMGFPNAVGCAAIHDFIHTASPGAAPVGLELDTNAFRTILFTDIEEHTALMQRLGDAAGRDVLREHERISRDALRAHGGTEIKTIGDSFMAAFSSVQKAVACAIALQRALTTQEVCGERLRIRVGINAGEPIAESDDLFGSSVILAARAKENAQGGEILVTDVVRQILTGKDFLFADRGEVALRGFEDPVRLYEVRWRD